MLFHAGERLLHFGEEPTRNGDHMGVTASFEPRHQVMPLRDPEVARRGCAFC
jgi:hypothetical protein